MKDLLTLRFKVDLDDESAEVSCEGAAGSYTVTKDEIGDWMIHDFNGEYRGHVCSDVSDAIAFAVEMSMGRLLRGMLDGSLASEGPER